MDAGEDTCHQRNATRERVVPPTLIQEHKEYEYRDIRDIVGDTAATGSILVVNNMDVEYVADNLVTRLATLGWLPADIEAAVREEWRSLFGC